MEHVAGFLCELPKQLLLSGVEAFRRLQIYCDVLVSTHAASGIGHTFASQPEYGAGLRAFWYVQRNITIQGRDLDLCAQGRLDKAQARSNVDIVALSLEDGAWTDLYRDKKVAGRAAIATRIALASQGDALPIVYTSRDRHAQSLLSPDASGTVAFGAGRVDDLAAPVTLGAVGGGLEHTKGRALLRTDCTRPLTIWTDLSRRSGCASRSLTIRALVDPGDVHLFFATKCRFFKGDRQPGPEALAPLGTISAGRAVRTAATETAESAAKSTEYISKDIAKIAEIACESASASAVVGIHARKTVLIVSGFLVAVRQDIISLIGLFEPGFRLLVSRVEIRVAFFRDPAICLFYLIV